MGAAHRLHLGEGARHGARGRERRRGRVRQGELLDGQHRWDLSHEAVAAAWVPGGGGAYAACRYGWAAAAPLQPCANGWPIAIVRAALGGAVSHRRGEGQTKADARAIISPSEG